MHRAGPKFVDDKHAKGIINQSKFIALDKLPAEDFRRRRG